MENGTHLEAAADFGRNKRTNRRVAQEFDGSGIQEVVVHGRWLVVSDQAEAASDAAAPLLALWEEFALRSNRGIGVSRLAVWFFGIRLGRDRPEFVLLATR